MLYETSAVTFLGFLNFLFFLDFLRGKGVDRANVGHRNTELSAVTWQMTIVFNSSFVMLAKPAWYRINFGIRFFFFLIFQETRF